MLALGVTTDTSMHDHSSMRYAVSWATGVLSTVAVGAWCFKPYVYTLRVPDGVSEELVAGWPWIYCVDGVNALTGYSSDHLFLGAFLGDAFLVLMVGAVVGVGTFAALASRTHGGN